MSFSLSGTNPGEPSIRPPSCTSPQQLTTYTTHLFPAFSYWICVSVADQLLEYNLENWWLFTLKGFSMIIVPCHRCLISSEFRCHCVVSPLAMDDCFCYLASSIISGGAGQVSENQGRASTFVSSYNFINPFQNTNINVTLRSKNWWIRVLVLKRSIKIDNVDHLKSKKSLQALYLGGTPSQMTVTSPPSCIHLDNRLYIHTQEPWIKLHSNLFYKPSLLYWRHKID